MAVGFSVGFSVGLAVGFSVGLGVGFSVGFSVAFGVAVGTGTAGADGTADAAASSALGRTSPTLIEPERSVRFSVPGRGSTIDAPCSAARKAVSWVMTSSAHALRVVASGPIRTTLPFVA